MSKLHDLINRLCPDGVPYKKLGDIVDILDSRRKPVNRGSRVSGKYPYYGANGVQDYINDYLFDGEFLLVGEDGSVITDKGTPILNWANGKIWVNNHAHVLQEKADKQYMLRYIKYALECKNIAKLIHGAIPKLNQQTLKSIEIPIPPLPVQSEIVRILDSFTELEAELEAELAGRKEQYEYYRNHLLDKKNLEHMDGKPVETKKLGDLADIGTGSSNTQDQEPDGIYPFYVRSPEVKRSSRFEFDETAVVTAGDGEVGKIFHFVEGKYALHQRAYRVKPTDSSLDAKFLYYYMKANFRAYVERKACSATVKSLRKPMFQNFELPVPSLDTQKRVVDILDRFDALTTSLTNGIPAEIAMRREQYEYYRSRLLDFPRLPDDSDSDGE